MDASLSLWLRVCHNQLCRFVSRTFSSSIQVRNVQVIVRVQLSVYPRLRGIRARAQREPVASVYGEDTEQMYSKHLSV